MLDVVILTTGKDLHLPICNDLADLGPVDVGDGPLGCLPAARSGW